MGSETEQPDAHASKSLKYLTVQDMLWINLLVTNKVRHFNFARLEEATFYQYGFGSSRDLARQAGRFLSGFMKLHPLEAGNEATAFVGCAAFLLLNGSRLDVSDADAAGWIEKVRNGQVRAEESLPLVNVDSHAPKSVRDAIQAVIDAYPETIRVSRVVGEDKKAS